MLSWMGPEGIAAMKGTVATAAGDDNAKARRFPLAYGVLRGRMSFSCWSTATELVAGLRKREISAVEVHDLFIAQIEKLNGRVNAICTLAPEARETAAAIDAAAARGEDVGALGGLPVSFKDSYETKGIRSTCGFPPAKDWVPEQDATTVARVRAAGGIPFAKTNVPPLLGGFHTDNPIFGRTNNPWNLACTSGGSSGGSGAAVAAAMTPLDMASDMLGSTRVPAHFCGVAGLKPTQYRISAVGHYPPMPGWAWAGNMLGTRGPMARRIEDLILMFPLLVGSDPRDPEAVPAPPLEEHAPKPWKDVRVAWTDDFGGVPVTRETRRILEDTARALEKAGARVEKASPPGIDFESIWMAAGEIYGGTIAYGQSPEDLASWTESLQAEADDGPIQRGTFQGARGDLFSWMRALEKRLKFILLLREFLTAWDGWLVPTTCAPAFRSDDYEKPIIVDGRSLPSRTAVGSHVAPFNLSGFPAVTFPGGLSDDGLPIGLQLVGPAWRDLQVLRLAQGIEQLIGPPAMAPLARG